MINAAAAVLLLDCGRFVPGTKLPSNFRALERITECRKGVTIYMQANKFKK